jgi:nicotinamidase-related amidase
MEVEMTQERNGHHHHSHAGCCGGLGRRQLLHGAGAAVGAGLLSAVAGRPAMAADDPYAPPKNGVLPKTDVTLEKGRAGLLVVDPLVDFLDPSGVAWKAVQANVEQLGTVDNLERLFKAAHGAEMPVFISPHYYFPYDQEWEFGSPMEKWMHDVGMFQLDGRFAAIEGTGADFLPRYKPYILDGRATVCLPHKVYGPQNNDVAMQLRKQGISQVILAGMSANLCVESHLRHLLEEGFEVAVVKDGTAAAQLPEGDGYLAALTNFRFLANALWTTEEAARRMSG